MVLRGRRAAATFCAGTVASRPWDEGLSADIDHGAVAESPEQPAQGGLFDASGGRELGRFCSGALSGKTARGAGQLLQPIRPQDEPA